LNLWFSHLPNRQGVRNGVLDDWWAYWVDFEAAVERARSAQQYCAISPTVGAKITSPQNGGQFTTAESINLQADSSISNTLKVEFYQGSQLLGTDNSAPYSFTWKNPAAGTYQISVRVYDRNGLASKSAPVNIEVKAASCAAPIWSAQSAYSSAQEVQYLGLRYKANWWNQGERPDLKSGTQGQGMPWSLLGSCSQ
jgi:chitinase